MPPSGPDISSSSFQQLFVAQDQPDLQGLSYLLPDKVQIHIVPNLLKLLGVLLTILLGRANVFHLTVSESAVWR